MAAKFRAYPGTRDFYPDQMEFRNWIFDTQRAVCERYGYGEYQAPILEPTDLYRAKSSEEIVNEQLYTFTDRGNREVSIRPEMTPTLARMAVDRPPHYQLPLRWFSIANFMRYERPGRGRLREFYQLNVDLLGAKGPGADAEILMIAVDLLRAFGASDEMFVVRISDRRLLDLWLGINDGEKLRRIGRLIDKKDKIGEEAFSTELARECEDPLLESRVRSFLAMDNTVLDLEPSEIAAHLHLEREKKDELLDVLSHLIEVRLLLRKTEHDRAVLFDPAIVRGFDYYTGLVFEIYDTNPENRRAIFGGGRYDRLLGQFGKEEIPAAGFGMGDVTLEHFLEGHGLKSSRTRSQRAFLTLMNPGLLGETMKLASELRSRGLTVETSLEATKKFGKQLELAEKKGFRYVLILGEDELHSETVIIKDLQTGTQHAVIRHKVADELQNR
jgi:histidyl-tRNA synthetase